MRRMMMGLAAALLGLLAAPAYAEFHLFRIDQVFSNADGSIQYVVLRESSGANGEHLWAGQTHALADELPAAVLVRRLSADARAALRAASARAH